MKSRNGIIVTMTLLGAIAAWAGQQPDAGALPPSNLLAPGAKLEEVARGFRFTEGPAADEHGDVWFTDIPNNRIHRYSVARNETTVEYENTGGANGLAFDSQGRLVACQGIARQLVRYDGDGGITVLAEAYEGVKLNSPNDLVIDEHGGIYFTDPRYGNRDDMQMQIEGVYYLDRRGQLVRVVDDLKRPNGVMLSPGGETLYVADEAARRIYAYDVRADGTLVNKRHFANTGDDLPGGADGLAVDERGNVYAACPGGVIVWNARGEHQTTIPVPGRPSNCTFAGLDGRELFITAGEVVHRVKMNVAGRRTP